MRLVQFLVIILTSLVFSSCGLTDNDEPLPFFLKLENPTVTSPTQTKDTHKITEVWVFADGQILGIFPLPAKVPVNFTGAETEITIFAGIRNNGMNDQPVFYPFYKSIVKKIKPNVGDEITIPLAFTYIEGTKFAVEESFENSNTFNNDIDANPLTFIKPTNVTSSLGSYSGEVTLSSDLKFVEVASSTEIFAGQNSRGASYIEFDYKGDGEIAVGLAKTTNGIIKIEYFLFVPGKDSWNKIYVDVTDKLSTQDYEKYTVLLAFTKTDLNEESKIYIDNYKHVHF